MEYKGKLMRTDNDSEMYFHAILPKSEKKRFRTEQIYSTKYSTEKMDG